MPIRLSQREFVKLVDEAMASLPEQFLPYLENLAVEVRPRPTREQLASMDLPPGTPLLGMYHGVPLTQKSVDAPFDWPEVVFIFQRSIEEVCETPEEVVDEIRTTVLHEIGHHFGFEEDELDDLGYA